MSFYSFLYKLMIFNQHGYLVRDIISILLAHILDPVHKLACNTFITQIVRYCNIESNSELAIIGDLPSRDILRNNLNIPGRKYYLLPVNSYRMISIVLKSDNLLRGESCDRIADLLHQLAIPRTKCFEIWFYFLHKDRGSIINIFNFFDINLGKYQVLNGLKFLSEIFISNRDHNPGQRLAHLEAYLSSQSEDH